MRCKVRKLCKTLSGLCLLFVVHVFLSFFVLNSDSEDAQQVVERHPSIQKRSLGDDEAGAGFLFDSLIPAANRRISELHPGDIPRRVRKLGNSVKVLRPKEETELQDVYISVKTTRKYHRDRLDLLLKTWVMFAQDVTYFFTDEEDEEFSKRTKGHLINTNCTAGHTRQALCCKMAVEYDSFIASEKRWFCHVDDDTYVNTGALVRLLRKYNHTEDFYLGKPSLSHPLQMGDKENPGQKIAFWFATGGAGFCISRGLALKMMPHTSGGRLKTVCEHIRLPDDCSIGYIISFKLKKELTIVKDFHSHLEGLWKINHRNIEDQITMSYMCMSSGASSKPSPSRNGCNSVDISSGFPPHVDPTRFLSVHCLLYPNLAMCQEIS